MCAVVLALVFLAAVASHAASPAAAAALEYVPAACTTAVFGEFQPPVHNPPAINSRDADVPLKFTLSGASGSW